MGTTLAGSAGGGEQGGCSSSRNMRDHSSDGRPKVKLAPPKERLVEHGLIRKPKPQSVYYTEQDLEVELAPGLTKTGLQVSAASKSSLNPTRLSTPALWGLSRLLC